jgi:pimeloyl-ACP methyl ester carboxylesterase
VTTSHEIRYASSGEAHIAFEVQGEGDGVDVIRLGAFLSNLEIQRRLPVVARSFERLASLGRLINFDSRGVGLSDRVRGSDLPTLEERLDDVCSVLDAARSERAVLVAFADGGTLASFVAATHPERVAALALLNTRPRIAWAPDYPRGLRPEEFAHLIFKIESGWGSRAVAAADWHDAPWEDVTLDEFVDWSVALMRQSGEPRDAATALRMFFDTDVRAVLPAIRVPTLVLSRGGEMAEEAAAMAGLIPGARHEVMPGTSPIVLSEHLDAYLDAVERFVHGLGDVGQTPDSALATVLCSDIADASGQRAELGDRRFAELVEEHHWIARECSERRRGHQLELAGDSFVAAFDGPVRAIQAARAIAEGVRRLGLEVRAGLHTGECRARGSEPGGPAADAAGRVLTHAAPSEIVVSQAVKDLVAGSDLIFDERGELEAAGGVAGCRLYSVAGWLRDRNRGDAG